MDNRFFNRRGFLKFTGVAGVALAGLAGAAAKVKADQGQPLAPIHPAQGGGISADEMDAMHEQGVKAFVDGIGKNPDFWGVSMPYTMDGPVKVFEITCTEADWETTPGQTVSAMMYNGRVPGPIIRVTQGETVRLKVTNQMTQSTAIHVHGLHMPNSMDGVPFITQPPIKPGKTFTYEFVAKNSGTHMYHSHHNSTEQVTRGLIGPFIIDPQDKANEPQVSGDYCLVLNDSGVGMTLNGKSFPSTQPILAKQGDRIRIRYMNEGLQIHPMHLHGMYQTVIMKDGAPIPIPYLVDTLLVGPGERYDVLVDCQESGVWAFHCHILAHAESNHGMFGMVTALVIK